MSYEVDITLATSEQIEAALCQRLMRIRLARNTTQQQLATEAGVAPRTIGRLEKGEGVSLDTFIRVLKALGIQQSLETLLPDPTIRPMDRIGSGPKERRRARPGPVKQKHPAWSWGDGEDADEQ